MTSKIETRRCSGGVKWGIEPHDAPVSEFGKNAGQKDGLSKTCRACNARYAELKRERIAAAAAPEAPEEAPSKAKATRKPRKPAIPRTGQEAPAIEEARAASGPVKARMVRKADGKYHAEVPETVPTAEEAYADVVGAL